VGQNVTVASDPIGSVNVPSVPPAPGRAGNKRSCRTPLVDTFEADFKGDNAKLIWPVSLDGKKMQSETYKILGIFDKPASK
jgi:hypothetical protein